MDLEGLIRPVVDGEGLQLWDVTLAKESGRRVLRVTIEKEGGVNLDTIATTSERISRRLDLEGFDAGQGGYALEVSSPGLERALRRPDHFTRSVGSTVKVKTRSEIDGARVFVGALTSADERAAVVTTEDGEHRIGYDDITSARTVFAWGENR